MRKTMKRFLGVVAVVALTGLSMASVASAADRLTVKDSASNAVFTVTDSGQVKLPVAAGSYRSSQMSNPSLVNNFAYVAFSPDQSAPNAGISFQVIPKATGYNAGIKAQLAVFNTDLIADSTNYEGLTLRAGGTAYSINSAKGGTGLVRPIQFQMQNTAKMTIDTTGYIGIGTTTPTHLLEVASGTIAISPATTTTAPAAGGAGALPSSPAGYMTITINGTDRLIPYY